MLAALLTPPGRGAIAVIHLSGDGSRTLLRTLFPGEIHDRPVHGKLVRDGEVLDEVMVRSVEGFTGDETVEITCHGGSVSVDRILTALAAMGVHRVDAVELLERGVETGRLDRIQAEAYALLPRAATELAARMLADQSVGALSRAVQAMSSPADASRLLETSEFGMALASPRRVVLTGRPNAGKSSLFNALVQADRVIVSPEPGTTRDPVRELIAIDQVPLELIDTAGVDASHDLLERLSIELTYRTLSEADVILFLFDAEAGAQGTELRFLEHLGHRRVVLVVNKIDVGNKKPLLEALPLSAKTGQGLDQLRRKILHALAFGPRAPSGAPVVFTPRQHRLLREVVARQTPPDAARDALLRGPL